MNFLKLSESILLEFRGHTLWITDKGKIINISHSGLTHHDWADKNRSKFKFNTKDINKFEMTAKSGWVKVKNHSIIDFEGIKSAIHKNKSAILKIIDDELFSGSNADFGVTIREISKDGNSSKSSFFRMPNDDSKLKRYL